jgi:hypothetical protein
MSHDVGSSIFGSCEGVSAATAQLFVNIGPQQAALHI